MTEYVVGVYGTLRKGGGNHHLIQGAEELGTHQIQGGYCMVDVGYFPGLIECDTEQHVTVEVYRVNEEQLQDLDWLEGNGDFYTRKEIEVAEGLTAWVYLLPEEYMSRPVIHSGDWMEDV